MLVLHSSSVCDICTDAYVSDDPDKVPHAVPCGHIFCKNCIGAFRSPNCPICRSRLIPDRVVKLHVDRIAESDKPDQSQQLDNERLILEVIHDQQQTTFDHERETSDYQLQIVFERETAQAIEAELLGKCKVLEDKIGELEAMVEGMRRKVLLERALKEQLAQIIQDSQQQMAFEKETAQAVEAVLIKKSKNLQDEVAVYEAMVEQLLTELRLSKDSDHRRNVQHPSDKRGGSSFVALLAGKTPCVAQAASSSLTRPTKNLMPSNDGEQDHFLPGTEEGKPKMFNPQTNSLADFQQNNGSEPNPGIGSTQQYQMNPQLPFFWTHQQPQTGSSQQPQQTGFLAQHPPGKSRRQFSGKNPFLQYMSPHVGDQQRISPRRNPFLQHISLHAGDQQRMPQQQTLGANLFLQQMSPYAGNPVMGWTLLTSGDAPSPAVPSTFRPTQVPGLQSRIIMESPTSAGDQSGAYDLRV
ncbi:hypothetical protein K443DRAFT_256451 [Laccaria amethystina LaAM-08-1]|uniref:RING-type domain-containing protein n=1 Tax=Laccaria amethystina LaAM-08-1 TaxID=1095629 RepID=A0A0C9WLF1_9AGAR|nr:hypothetical protein K443DRAFT_256451 [Laccaria amethystina LaAM-08-1]